MTCVPFLFYVNINNLLVNLPIIMAVCMMYNHDCRYILAFTIVHFDCLFDGTSIETNCSMLEVSCFI